MRYRYVKEGEFTQRDDIAKHKCGCYWYETEQRHPEPHRVDSQCASSGCYRRPIKAVAQKTQRKQVKKISAAAMRSHNSPMAQCQHTFFAHARVVRCSKCHVQYERIYTTAP
jgi:hypothetical protein